MWDFNTKYYSSGRLAVHSWFHYFVVEFLPFHNPDYFSFFDLFIRRSAHRQHIFLPTFLIQTDFIYFLLGIVVISRNHLRFFTE